MSLLIAQLAAYLQGRGEGTVGVDLFCLHRPASPVSCLSLHATGGYPPDAYTAREHPTVMVFAREATPEAALRRAYRLHGLLHGRQNLGLGGGLWALTIEAMASPVYLGSESVPEGLAHLASLNLLFDLRRPSS